MVNVDNIKVWEDKWISRDNLSKFLVNQLLDEDKDLKVCDILSQVVIEISLLYRI